MLNCDINCKGEYTRVERGNRSVIDYVMVSEEMYKYYKSMEIDEERVRYDLSDHVYIFIDLIINEKKPKYGGVKLEEVDYWKVRDDELMGDYTAELERRV